MKPIILASQSPRRREICAQLGIPFTVCPAQSEAPFDPTLSPQEAVKAIARSKAEEIAATHPGEVVLGSDTVVAIDGVILGKPKTEADAAAMLRSLSGRTHQVLTGVWVVDEDGNGDGFTSVASVKFADMSDADIAAYIATGEPMDKAGSYGVQGKGSLLVEKLNGDFFNVMGLPVLRLSRMLSQFGINLL